ncbi:hypothetical protein H7Y40_00325 [Pedobacter sp.]|nr:hypothetical protein [Candidatus Saccharibacteria bacterium]
MPFFNSDDARAREARLSVLREMQRAQNDDSSPQSNVVTAAVLFVAKNIEKDIRATYRKGDQYYNYSMFEDVKLYEKFPAVFNGPAQSTFITELGTLIGHRIGLPYRLELDPLSPTKQRRLIRFLLG